MSVPEPPFDHLVRLTNGIGIFEHANEAMPRREHGYCTDDVARLLLVTIRQPDPTDAVNRLTRVAFRFLAEAQGPDGRCHNRRSARGRWQDRASMGDWWGRSIWAFGAAMGSREAWMRDLSRYCFERGATQRSDSPRSMAFAALGAAEAVRFEPGNRAALALLADAAAAIGSPAVDPKWPWPEARLSYANAVLPDAMMAAGVALGRPALVRAGLDLLTWLLHHETTSGHLSVTPVGGAAPGDPMPAFDQQPIEVAALADACARAATIDDTELWPRAIASAVAWFCGENDSETPMWDPATGGGFDGLHADGANKNQGAESTLALVSTLQHAQHLRLVSR